MPVTEPQNWLTYYGAYDGQRYSLLDQINTENVKRLGPAWIFQAGTTGQIAGASTYSFEAAPIVVDGVMFLSPAGTAGSGPSTPRQARALALQARGPLRRVTVLRQRQPRLRSGQRARSTSSPPNAHLLALDATNGKRCGRRPYGDVRAGESATVAPLVVKNMLIAGSSGGEFGVRGHIDAFDLEYRRTPVALLHGPEAGRTGLRDLACRR